MRSGSAAAVRIVMGPPMQYPVVPILRFLSTEGWASSQATKAFASVTCVSGVSEPARPMSAVRVAGSPKSGFSGAVGAFFVR